MVRTEIIVFNPKFETNDRYGAAWSNYMFNVNRWVKHYIQKKICTFQEIRSIELERRTERNLWANKGVDKNAVERGRLW